MSIDVTWSTKSSSSDRTEQLGEALGKALRGGEVIELASDLGGGKTTFTRGLVRGIGSQDKVASPTFTISRVYDAGRLQVHHFDFYRLHEPGIVANELAELVDDPQVVTVIEWGDIVQDVLPANRLTIHITTDPDGNRELTFSGISQVEPLVNAVRSC